MKETNQKLIQLIRKATIDNSLSIEFRMEDDDEIYQLACDQGMSHLIGGMIEKNKIRTISKHKKDYQRRYYSAIRQVLLLNEEIKMLKILFEDNNTDFILLKGAVLRSLYPEEWMRVSGDIDVLIRDKDLKRVTDLLEHQKGYQFVNRCEYHESFKSPGGLTVEIHFTLSDEQGREKELLDRAWAESIKAPYNNNEYLLNDKYLYFYNIYHMAKHFRAGGPGIKLILDIWMLNHKTESNRDARVELLKEGNLYLFAQSIEVLSEKWFSSSNVSIDEELEDYILLGGEFGKKQRVVATQAQSGSRINFVFRRAFPPYRIMRGRYPKLNNCPPLLPFFWIHRLVTSMRKGKSKLAKYELKKSKEDQVRSERVAELFERIGLL